MAASLLAILAQDGTSLHIPAAAQGNSCPHSQSYSLHQYYPTHLPEVLPLPCQVIHDEYLFHQSKQIPLLKSQDLL
jgi:hypothetical protein